MKTKRIALLAMITSMVVFYLEIISVFSLGKVINTYISCKQEPTNSFPCYGIYDIYFLVFLVIAFTLATIIFVAKVIKTKKPHQ